MAKFIADFTRIIDVKLVELRQRQVAAEQAAMATQVMQPAETTIMPVQRNTDPDNDRVDCHMCRYIVFGQDDLQDPPHVPSRHHFWLLESCRLCLWQQLPVTLCKMGSIEWVT